MNKLLCVLQREYLQEVRKKSFLIMSVLFPFLMVGMMLVPALLARKGIGEKRVAVLDGTGRLGAAFQKEESARSGQMASSAKPAETPVANLGRRQTVAMARVDTEYVAAKGDLPEITKQYLSRLTGKEKDRQPGKRLDGVLLVPADAFENSGAKLTFYSRSAVDFAGQEVGRIVNQEVSRQRLRSRGFDPSEVDRLLKRLSVEGIQVSRKGEEKKGGKGNFLVGFLFAMLLFIPMLAYGTEIMRGIVQEKNDRVVEILISSMSPFQLLSGKVLGMAAVSLTQVAIWISMGGLAAAFLGTAAAAADMNLGQFLRPSIIPYFLLFYILGYLIYVCIYAVGGAVANSEKEAQQFLLPILLFVMLPWILLTPILMNPESQLATVLSLIPFFAPITMFIRILVSEPPGWQIALSIVLSAAAVYGLFWMTAKIFRVGILSYGKRPTIPELWRWLKVA